MHLNTIKLAFPLALVLFISSFAGAQRIYYNRDGEIIDSSGAYYRYEVREVLPSHHIYVKFFAHGDTLTSEGAYSVFTKSDKTAEGLHKYYNRNTGNLHYSREYAAGKIVGDLRSYYPSGALKRIEHYKDGKVDGGECFREDGSTMPYTPFEVQPQYPGGENAMLQMVVDNVKYPALARENGIEGIAIVSFVVNTDGSLSDIQIVRDPGGGCGMEAVRVVSKMAKWTPGQLDDQPVKVKFHLPVRFKLEGRSPRKKNKR